MIDFIEVKKDFEKKDRMWAEVKLDIVSRIDIKDKYFYIKLFDEKFTEKYFNLDNKLSIYDVSMAYDMDIVFNLLLLYANIMIKEEDKTIENYDFIIKSGLYDHIISYCKEDYKDLVKKTNRIIGINNLKLLYELMDIVNSFDIKKDMSDIVQTVNGLDVEKLNILNNIQKFNNMSFVK